MRTNAITARISTMTPMLVAAAMCRIPAMFTIVVTTRRITPSRTAFWAPVAEVSEESAPDPPTSWKPDQILGRTAWIAIAAAATVRIWPMTMTQPVNQPATVPANRLDHWKIAPETGHRAASSAKHSATSNCPRKTSGQAQKNDAPPSANPSPKSWNTVVRIETNENPAAKDENVPTPRRSSWA
jgi:hypothetical protein